MNEQPSYQFYATLLDGFQNYLDSSEIWQEYWGNSDSPSKSEAEYEKEAFQGLIDRINRVPFDSEAADKGSAFNEVIDCLIENRLSEKAQFRIDGETGQVWVEYNQRTFVFPLATCQEVADYFKDATTQVYTQAFLQTKYGLVSLYGYIDELMPQSVHDIKTTGQYKAGKFRKGWQHIVYPYCLNENGNHVSDFEYNVVLMGAKDCTTYTEFYTYQKERDVMPLVEHVERLIEFLEAHRYLITDLKIFNLQTELVEHE